MTNTQAATIPTAHYGHSRQWLRDAADRLDRQGRYDLAAEARYEAGLPDPRPGTAPVLRCDGCGRPVRAQSRLARFEHVDWVVCSRCETEG